MPDPYGKFRQGDKRRLPAQLLNNAIDATRAERQSRFNQSTPPPIASQYGPTTVRIQNETGGDLDQFSIVKLGAPIITSTDNLDEFQSKVNFQGQTPAAVTDTFAVLQEPLTKGDIGRGVVSGATAVLIDVTDTSHKFATPNVGDASQLKSAATGNAIILSPISATGSQWAVALLQAPPLTATLTVDVDSGDTVVNNVSTLRFYDKNHDGGTPSCFSVTEVSTGIAEVKLLEAQDLVWGAVTYAAQRWMGNKTFYNDVEVVGTGDSTFWCLTLDRGLQFTNTGSANGIFWPVSGALSFIQCSDGNFPDGSGAVFNIMKLVAQTDSSLMGSASIQIRGSGNGGGYIILQCGDSSTPVKGLAVQDPTAGIVYGASGAGGGGDTFVQGLCTAKGGPPSGSGAPSGAGKLGQIYFDTSTTPPNFYYFS